jgi:hypothetical protein
LQPNLVSWLNTDNPDIILLKIGTNSQDTNSLEILVNTIVTTKSNARLVIAEIIPNYTYQAGIVTYNNYIHNTLVHSHQALGQRITLVNQYATFLTNPADLTTINQSLFSNGINHPNNEGYDRMAQVWLNGIDALGLRPNNYSNWISGFPGIGLKTTLTEDADGDDIGNGVENFFGTNPGTFSKGLVAVAKSGNAFTFTHPLNATPASDLTGTYRWSRDLATFTPGGTAFQGTTVIFNHGTPSGGFVTVTATVIGTQVDKLFVDVKVTQN